MKTKCGIENCKDGPKCERAKGHRGFHWGKTIGHIAFWRETEKIVTNKDVASAEAWLARQRAQ